MLVCSVALRARRTVAASIAEAGAALDFPNTLGLGQLVEEATSAADTVNAISRYGAAILETASAIDSLNATLTSAGVFAGTVAEVAAAVDTPDAGTVSAGGVARDSMIDGVQVNSDGTARQANAGGTMVNL